MNIPAGTVHSTPKEFENAAVCFSGKACGPQ